MMRTLILMVLSGTLLLSSGCIRSLHSIYTNADLVFEPILVGQWGEDNSKETLTFSRKGTNEYKLVYTDSAGKRGTFSAHLAKIKGKLFLDFSPTELGLKESAFYTKSLLLPVHTFAYVKQIEPTLQISFPDADWLEKYIAAHPKAIRHAKIEDELVLTAATKELQVFWLKHLDAEGAFEDPCNMKRKK